MTLLRFPDLVEIDEALVDFVGASHHAIDVPHIVPLPIAQLLIALTCLSVR